MPRTYRIADLFCGAGGSSTGALQAARSMGAEVDLVAVNHWDIAIATHQRNHPAARHYCVNLDAARPEDLVPGGSLDLLMASPECVFFSRARGGRPSNDQRRMSAWHVQRWASAIDIRCILVENVPEFRDWGPLTATGKPDPTRRGVYFQAWVEALWKMGYVVDWKLLNAADYGDATTRTRFFLQARKDGDPIRWPEPSHTPLEAQALFGRLKPWRSAREIIDWDDHGTSLLNRKRPLSIKTRLRIARGLKRFGGPLAALYIQLLDLPQADEAELVDGVVSLEARPFVLANRNHNTPKDIDDPVPGLTTATGGGLMLTEPTIEPFVLGQHGGSVARDAALPLPTITADGAISLIDPILVPYYRTSEAASVDVPLATITTKARFGLCNAMVVPYGPRAEARSVDSPLPTIMTRDRLGVCSPFLVPQFGERTGQEPRVHGLDQPLPSVTSHGAGALVHPLVLPCVESVGPLAGQVVQINGLAYLLDIRFRMLRNKELARAMGFDDELAEYEFSGNVGEVTKQIGNAVAVGTARALVLTILQGATAPTFEN